jgi:hypothetical protein
MTRLHLKAYGAWNSGQIAKFLEPSASRLKDGRGIPDDRWRQSVLQIDKLHGQKESFRIHCIPSLQKLIRGQDRDPKQ